MDLLARAARSIGRLAVAAAGLAVIVGTAHGQSWGHDESHGAWSYLGDLGEAHWGELDPAYERCSNGTMQSPIDIRDAERMVYAPLAFHYRSQPFEAVNDGHGVRIIAPPGGTLSVQGRAFDLREFHFHVPGEHAWNGATAAGELHFVHTDPDGALAILAVPMRAGLRSNSILKRIVERLPASPGERVLNEHLGINPVFLLPPERSYFRYVGSLEIPPCTEPVLWFVLADPLEIDPDDLRTIARISGPNARSIQPANGREVQAFFRR